MTSIRSVGVSRVPAIEGKGGVEEWRSGGERSRGGRGLFKIFIQ